MSKRRQRTARYSAYQEKKFASRGIAALVLGLLSLLLLAVLAFWSVSAGETVTAVIGALGLTAFIMALAGLYLGQKSFQEDVRSYAVSKFGTILCALISAGWFLLICWGIASGLS